MSETLTPTSFEGTVVAQEPGHVSYETTGIIDASAAISLRKSDLRLAEAARDALDDRYDGLLSRQTAADVMSMPLADGIFIEFRREVQRRGFTDPELMPSSDRASLAQMAAQAYRSDILAELEGHHPNWTPDQIAVATDQRIQDIVTLLSMTTGEHGRYQQAVLDFYQANANTAALTAEIADLRLERQQHARRLGVLAVQGFFNGIRLLRDAPYAIHTRVSLGTSNLAQRARTWFAEKTPESRQGILVTAASVAVVGIATYIWARTSGYSSVPSGDALKLVSHTSDTLGNVPDHAPDMIGNTAPSAIGTDQLGAIAPVRIGGIAPDDIGNHLAPTDIGGKAPINIGTPEGMRQAPANIGGQTSAPENIGGVAPENIGIHGVDLSGAHATTEFFSADTYVGKWPDTITVGSWNSQTKDGSLWGISTRMLQRSGVVNPSKDHVTALVDILRPQAQPNGWLVRGQILDLRPVHSLLPS